MIQAKYGSKFIGQPNYDSNLLKLGGGSFMQIYDSVYFIGNIFMAFVIYKYVHIFYSECKVNSIYEIIAYGGYFISISAIHLLFKIPLIVFFSNILLIFLCTCLYVGGIKKAVLSTLNICLSLTCIETLIAFLSSFLDLNPLMPFDYHSSFGIIVIRIVSYMFVLALNGFKNVRKESRLPTAYWISLVVIPSSTISLLFSVFTAKQTTKSLIIICIICAVLINILTFYLYDKISILIIKQMNERVALEQNTHYEKQLQMMRNSLNYMKTLRHDLNNKLSPLLSLANNGDLESVKAHISELMQYTSSEEKYVDCGNNDIDSILNYKLQKANKDEIRISTNIVVPSDLTIPSFDLAVILGNILDNALEAVDSVTERWIDIKIRYTKGRLIIEVSNTYDGVVNIVDGDFISRKCDKENHGLGFQSVKSVIQKYEGLLQITHDDKMFKTKLLIYI
jgi:hypothetical protein